MSKIPGIGPFDPRARRRRSASLRAHLEPLESRSLLATFVVNSTGDDMPPSDVLTLRQAIELSNGTLVVSALSPMQQAQVSGPPSTPNTIDFDIAPGGVQTISLESALPAITEPVIIDGTSQPGYEPAHPTPLIELSGRQIATSDNGLVVAAAGCTIEGLVIDQFNGSGIVLEADDTRVIGDYIGTDPTGTKDRFNSQNGVVVYTSGNTIGGTTAVESNLISNNQGSGVLITPIADVATGNLVQGNLIGTDITGTGSMGNLLDGVAILGASGNTIGGDVQGAANLISVNGRDGILIQPGSDSGPQDAANNVIEGNSIGTDIAGTRSLGNFDNGVEIINASANTIGGTTAAAGNLISGNLATGVKVEQPQSTANVIEGNFIGTTASGELNPDGSSAAILSNLQGGVVIDSAPDNLVGGTTAGARNVISGNEGDQVRIVGPDATGNRVEGDFLGTDATGLVAVGGTGNGVDLDGGTSDNTIGGTTPGASNVISGNLASGITVQRQSHTNVIQGNLIGPDNNGTNRPMVDSTHRQGNAQNGVTLLDGASDNVIGGTTPEARNVISGNGGNGVDISNGATGNLVLGNFVGVDAGGATGLGNAQNGVFINDIAGNTVGGIETGARNVISGNSLNGIQINAGTVAAGADGGQVRGNVVQGNFVGTDVTGRAAIGNVQNGLYVFNSPGNTIGGPAPGAGNVFSGNRLSGVSVFGPASTNNVLQGNRIGTDLSGTRAIGNAQDGVLLTDSSANLVGGTTAAATNVISGNSGNGVDIRADSGSSATGNVVEGNMIGIDATASRSLGNGASGVAIVGATGNMIGGTSPAARNVISGNGTNGVALSGSSQVVVEGNFVGTDGTGASAVANGNDGVLIDASSQDLVGGTAPGAGNVISGNGVSGVEISGTASSGNAVAGNVIGPAAGGVSFVEGSAGEGNLAGVTINGASSNLIGGTTPAARNLISGNSRPDGSGIGIQILGVQASNNRVWGNDIGTDSSGTQALRNDVGVLINGVSGNFIGGPVAGSGNLISGNVRPDTSGIGVEIVGAGASSDTIEGNLIGTDASGTRTLVAVQPDLGILISNTSGNNVIGGTTDPARNVVAGFKVGIEVFANQSQFNQTPGSIIQGNYLGTDGTGLVVLGNGIGIYINGVPRNTIGGTAPGARNVISGNQTGLLLLGATASRNLIQGNYLGLDPSGRIAEGNHIAIALDGASQNTIGGTTPGAGNIIAGNLVVRGEGSIGIYLYFGSANNTILGNSIGTDAFGRSSKSFRQGDYGVLLYNAANNPIARSSRTNRIVRSGIANVREFTSPGGASHMGAGKTAVRGRSRPRPGHQLNRK